MQVSVEELGGLQRRMTVQVPAQEIDQEIQSRLQDLCRRVKLAGFRPGKVPLKVVRRMYGPQVRQEVMGERLESSFHEALHERSLHPAGQPSFEPHTMGEGEDLAYAATFEVFPEFEINGVEGIQVTRPAVEITEADVDAMVESLRRQRTRWSDVERPARDGDRVTIGFEGRIDGEAFPGNTGEDVPVVLGAGAMVPEFEAGLHGVEPGQETTFDVTFPEDYPGGDLAGRTATFTVRVGAVAEPVLPEVDAEFIESFGIEDGSVEGLREALRNNMQRELDEAIAARLKRQVMDQLLKANAIDLPQVMVDQEIERMARQSNPGQDAAGEDPAAREQAFGEEARRRVALGLIIAELIKTREIKLDQERVHQRIARMAAVYQEPEEVVQYYYQNPQALEGVRALALEDQVVDWLLEHAQVNEQPSTFEAVVKGSGGASQ